MQNGDDENKKYWNLLNIFAYGKYKDYLSDASNLPPLSPTMLKKLKHLTLIAVTSKCKVRLECRACCQQISADR